MYVHNVTFVYLRIPQVGSLREEVARGHSSRTGEEPDENRSGTSLGNRLYMTKEIDQLKEKVTGCSQTYVSSRDLCMHYVGADTQSLHVIYVRV